MIFLFALVGGRVVRRSCPGRPTIWMTIGQGPTALAVGAGEDSCLEIFTLSLSFLSFSSLLRTARYRPKYCLKGPLNPIQQTNQLFALAVKVSLYARPV